MTALLILLLLAGAFGLALGYAAVRFKVEGNPLTDAIDAKLPQTQCGQCGYPGCRPYAEAIAKGEVAINKCPPGGQETVNALAELLGIEAPPLDVDENHNDQPLVAFIREAECIGCTLCIKACPVDAIVGTTKMMHTVIGNECTGCKLCVEPCPVSCIDMVPVAVTSRNYIPTKPKSLVEAAHHA